MSADLSPFEHEAAVLGGTPGFCRAISPDRVFMCDQPTGHEGDHRGFEMPTVHIDDNDGAPR